MEAKEKTALLYSRDAIPLRKLEKVLAEIRNGTFSPDVTRSGYFPRRFESAREGKREDDSEYSPSVAAEGHQVQEQSVDDGSDRAASDSEDSQDEEDNEADLHRSELAADEVVGDATIAALDLDEEPDQLHPCRS